VAAAKSRRQRHPASATEKATLMKDHLAQEMKLYWGAENLTRWPERSVRGLRIPAASKEFLTHLGLPSLVRDVAGWYFEWELDLPRFDNGRELRLLARNCGFSPFLIDENRDGCILWRADDQGYERYVNASVEQFAACLLERDKFSQETLRTIDDPFDKNLFARRITTLEQELKAIDATAIATKESMWRSDIFGMRLELK
jgi:hypothetical protein